MVHIGQRIFDARTARGWDQSDLARRAGVHPSYVSRLESGKVRNPSAGKVRKLADALGTPVTDLTEGPPVPSDTDAAQDLWRRIVAALGPERAHQFADMARELGNLTEPEQDFALRLFASGVFEQPSRRRAPS